MKASIAALTALVVCHATLWMPMSPRTGDSINESIGKYSAYFPSKPGGVDPLSLLQCL